MKVRKNKLIEALHDSFDYVIYNLSKIPYARTVVTFMLIIAVSVRFWKILSGAALFDLKHRWFHYGCQLLVGYLLYYWKFLYKNSSSEHS
jgi:hypothetical protein